MSRGYLELRVLVVEAADVKELFGNLFVLHVKYTILLRVCQLDPLDRVFAPALVLRVEVGEEDVQEVLQFLRDDVERQVRDAERQRVEFDFDEVVFELFGDPRIFGDGFPDIIDDLRVCDQVFVGPLVLLSIFLFEPLPLSLSFLLLLQLFLRHLALVFLLVLLGLPLFGFRPGPRPRGVSRWR